jgi:hypothetical protein
MPKLNLLQALSQPLALLRLVKATERIAKALETANAIQALRHNIKPSQLGEAILAAEKDEGEVETMAQTEREFAALDRLVQEARERGVELPDDADLEAFLRPEDRREEPFE